MSDSSFFCPAESYIKPKMSDSEREEEALPCECGGKQSHLYRVVKQLPTGKQYGTWKPLCEVCYQAIQDRNKAARAANRAR